MFLTDGEESCGTNNRDDIPGDITNPDLLNDIVDRKIRVVTIAFG